MSKWADTVRSVSPEQWREAVNRVGSVRFAAGVERVVAHADKVIAPSASSSPAVCVDEHGYLMVKHTNSQGVVLCVYCGWLQVPTALARCPGCGAMLIYKGGIDA